jgi:hypothetical protein
MSRKRESESETEIDTGSAPKISPSLLATTANDHMKYNYCYGFIRVSDPQHTHFRQDTMRRRAARQSGTPKNG